MKNIVVSFREKKSKEPISVLTCYDYSFARILSATDLDALLIGDSLGMVMQGHSSTLPVSLDEMIYHTKAVRRGAPDKFLILDLPFLSYQPSLEEGIRSAGRAMKESGADCIKLEGGDESTLELIHRLTQIGIPVMAHIGLTPQSYQTLGGYRVQGKDPKSREKLEKQAKDIENAGAFSLVLELIPEDLGKTITESLSITTIGIGAGVFTDGQVLVLQDMLGMNPDFSPKFLKRYENLYDRIRDAVQSYHQEVVKRKYPDKEHSF